MRVLEINRRLTLGRIMTEQKLNFFSDAFQETTPIIEALEIFYKLNSGSSEQYKTLRGSLIKRPKINPDAFLAYLYDHSPFTGNVHLKNISTGHVANSNVNCHKDIEIGMSIASQVYNASFDACKLKHKDSVVNMSEIHNVKKDGEENFINPEILFPQNMFYNL